MKINIIRMLFTIILMWTVVIIALLLWHGWTKLVRHWYERSCKPSLLVWFEYVNPAKTDAFKWWLQMRLIILLCRFITVTVYKTLWFIISFLMLLYVDLFHICLLAAFCYDSSCHSDDIRKMQRLKPFRHGKGHNEQLVVRSSCDCD